jgi:8-oxo-dGTP diphosphatase
MIEYNFCPKCGKKVVRKDLTAYCDNCKITYYQNSKPAASVLIIKGSKVLLSRRGREPHKGELDIVGGFLEYDEDPKVAALREVKEETGLEVKIIDLLGIYIDTYGAGGPSILNIHYIGEIVSGEPKPQDDISALEWYEIDKVPTDQGPKNTQDGLKDFKKWYAKRK